MGLTEPLPLPLPGGAEVRHGGHVWTPEVTL